MQPVATYRMEDYILEHADLAKSVSHSGQSAHHKLLI